LGDYFLKESKQFFFEKKNQKTFAPLRACVATPVPHTREAEQSFFASFFSKKEVFLTLSF